MVDKSFSANFVILPKGLTAPIILVSIRLRFDIIVAVAEFYDAEEPKPAWIFNAHLSTCNSRKGGKRCDNDKHRDNANMVIPVQETALLRFSPHSSIRHAMSQIQIQNCGIQAYHHSSTAKTVTR